VITKIKKEKEVQQQAEQHDTTAEPGGFPIKPDARLTDNSSADNSKN
jgi:alpha-D-ribose 1-methylphosphonate 5-triphosphate synthase subunit PhnI